jgi:hypothetical protein
MTEDSTSALTVGKNFNYGGYGAQLAGAVTVYGTATFNTLGGTNQIANLTTYSGFYQNGALTSTAVTGTLTAFGTGVNIQNGTFTNSGIVNGNLTLQGGSFANNGTLNGNSNIRGGILSGMGIFNGSVFNGAGTTMAGAAGTPGVLNIFGNYQQSGGILNEQIGSATSSSLINVSGKTLLNSGAELSITLLNGFDPVGDKFDILGYGSLSGKFANGSTFSEDGYNWDLAYGPNDVTLTAVSPALSVPEPSSLSMLVAGLCFCLPVIYITRKRTSKAELS